MPAATLKKANVYLRLEQAIASVADSWSEDIELDADPGTRSIHLLVARSVLRLAFKQMDSVPKAWGYGISDEGIKKLGAPTKAPYAGCKVMALHTYHGALAAGTQGLDEEMMKKALCHPASFDPLQRMTELSGEIAMVIERAHGLNHTRICDDGLFLVAENRYAIENGAVVMPRLEREISLEQRDVLDENIGEDATCEQIANVLNGKDCLAQKTGVLKDIHSHLVAICIKDTRLAIASLNNGLAARLF